MEVVAKLMGGGEEAEMVRGVGWGGGVEGGGSTGGRPCASPASRCAWPRFRVRARARARARVRVKGRIALRLAKAEAEAERAERATLPQRLDGAPLRRDFRNLAQRAPQRSIHRHNLCAARQHRHLQRLHRTP
eukprot:scaffold71506_cov48-Phaeocystis_antarctica.AAC.3